MYAIPRLIFLTAPLIYLLLNHTNVPGYWAAILAYALPHLILSNVTNSRIQGEHRHSFWNEIYETVLSPYILLPTMMALINPKLGKFNVTAKGGVVKRTFFDTRIAQPFLILLIFNMAGILIAIPRFFIWDRDRPGTVVMNVIWCVFNVVILGVTHGGGAGDEAAPHHGSHRAGHTRDGQAVRWAPGGGRNHRHVVGGIEHPLRRSAGGRLRMPRCGWSFRCRQAPTNCGPTVVSSEGSVLRVKFHDLTIAEQEVLTMVLYSRADSWLGWGESRENDNVMRSLQRIFQISMHGLVTTFKSLFVTQKKKTKQARTLPAISSALIFALGLILGASAPATAGPGGHQC